MWAPSLFGWQMTRVGRCDNAGRMQLVVMVGENCCFCSRAVVDILKDPRDVYQTYGIVVIETELEAHSQVICAQGLHSRITQHTFHHIQMENKYYCVPKCMQGSFPLISQRASCDAKTPLTPPNCPLSLAMDSSAVT